MRLGIMQPYFFPYAGHFGLIASVEEWIIFDVTQYTPKTWMNRNRVLHPKRGTNWITVPLANSSISIMTHEAQVLDLKVARQSVLGKLTHYKAHVRRARYDKVCSLVDAAFADCSDDSLVNLNARGLAACCDVLGFPFRFRICSELQLDLPTNPGPGGWAPLLCQRLGATAYVNPEGGRSLFDPDDFQQIGIELLFAETQPLLYGTQGLEFLSGLSLLDVLMWNDVAWAADAIRAATRLLPAEAVTV